MLLQSWESKLYIKWHGIVNVIITDTILPPRQIVPTGQPIVLLQKVFYSIFRYTPFRCFDFLSIFKHQLRLYCTWYSHAWKQLSREKNRYILNDGQCLRERSKGIHLNCLLSSLCYYCANGTPVGYSPQYDKPWIGDENWRGDTEFSLNNKWV